MDSRWAAGQLGPADDSDDISLDWYAERLPIFVYGTLRTGQRNYHRWGDAIDRTARAVVHDVAVYRTDRPYPFALPRSGSQVVGEVFWLTDDRRRAEPVRRLLDRTEGFDPRTPSAEWFYERIRAKAQTEAGPRIQVECWLYIAGPQDAARLRDEDIIASGDWIADRSGRDQRAP